MVDAGARSSTSTSWTATSSRRCRWARRWSSALRGRGRDGELDVHLMVERPERHVADFAEGRRRRHHRPRRGDAARQLRRCRRSARPAAAPASPCTPPRRSAVFEELERRRGALHDRQPGLGRPGLHPRAHSRRSPAASAARRRGRARGRRRHRRRDRRAGAEAGARSSCREAPCSGPGPGRRLYRESAAAAGCGQP